MASWELKVHHDCWPWACIICSGAMAHDVYRRHYRTCPVSRIDLIISRTWWHGHLITAQGRVGQHTACCDHVSIPKVTSTLAMRDGNRPRHQIGELRIDAVNWLDDGCGWFRIFDHSLPTVVDHGRQVSLLILRIEIVIGLSQDSCLLDRTYYFSWLFHFASSILLLVIGVDILS